MISHAKEKHVRELLFSTQGLACQKLLADPAVTGIEMRTDSSPKNVPSCHNASKCG